MTPFQDICQACGLGQATEAPRQLSGGFLHQMYSLFTASGRYAVKLLNPSIMARPEAMGNFRAAEALEARLEAAALPIVPALTFHGQKMQCLDGQYYYVFPWCEGRALRPEEITPAHAACIGKLLAEIHGVDRRAVPAAQPRQTIDWDGFLPRLTGEMHHLLAQHLDLLHTMQDAGNAALDSLPPVSAICHNDMDGKNVLWVEDKPQLIDLECLTYAQPMLEVMELALHWSGADDCAFDPARFRAFMAAYRQAGGVLVGDWNLLCRENINRLGWLEYNLTRLDDPALAGVARQEVVNALERLAYQMSITKDILQCLEE